MYKLRRATLADREALAAMYRSFEPKGASLGMPPRGDLVEGWLDSLSDYPNSIVVCEGRLVAHGVLAVGKVTAEVAVFVHQDCRRRGLGKLLLADLVDEGKRLGLQGLWGITESDNVPMLGLARSLGFVLGTDPGTFYVDLQKQARPVEQEIRRRAYEIYLARGGIPGREVDDWVEAERELCSEYQDDFPRLFLAHLAGAEHCAHSHA